MKYLAMISILGFLLFLLSIAHVKVLSTVLFVVPGVNLGFTVGLLVVFLVWFTIVHYAVK